MIVYSLNYKNNPQVPFYIGITNNIKRRFKQHKQNYKHHKPYITNKNDFIINKICDTGNNQYSKTLAEKIETNLIKYYNTVNHGSNKVYTTHKFSKEIWNPENYKTTYNKCFNKHSKEKAKKTRQKNKHKKFKKILKTIHDDPCAYTTHELIKKSNFKNQNALDNYCKKYHNLNFNKWLTQYQQLWLKYIITQINNKQKSEETKIIEPLQ